MPNFLKEFGFSDDEINKCFKGVEKETEQREKLLDELSDLGFEITLTKEDFPVKWYEVKYNDKQAIMNHDVSPYLFFMQFDHKHMEAFDPAILNVVDAIKDYMNKFGTDVPIDKKI